MSKKVDIGEMLEFQGVNQFGYKKPNQDIVQGKLETSEATSQDTITDIVSKLMENSSSHGVPNIYRAKHPKRRSLWVLLFLCAIGAFLWQVSSLIIKFYSYEVNVLLDVEFQPSIKFPAITVCNMNPVLISALKNNDDLDVLINGPQDVETQTNPSVIKRKKRDDPCKSISPPPSCFATMTDGQDSSSKSTTASTTASPFQSNNSTAFNGTTTQITQPSNNSTAEPSIIASKSTTASTTASPVKNDSSFQANENTRSTASAYKGTTISRTTEEIFENWDDKNIDYKSQDDRFILTRTVQDYMAKTPYHLRGEFGHSLDNFLIDCSWQGYPCGPINFTRIYNYMYGNCYTFNSGMDGDILTISKPGPLYGLSLQLYIEQSEYIADLQQSAGVKIILHSQDVMPFPEDDGFTAAPGMETSIGLKMIEISRKPKPYGDCFKSDEIYRDNIFTRFYDVEYSQKVCEKNCLHDYVIEYCNCSDFRYQYPDEKYPICANDNEEQSICYNMVDKLYKDEQLACDCPQKCHEESYLPVVSNALWPNEQYENTIMENLMTKSKDLKEKVSGDDDFVGKNDLKLDIYYQELNHEHIKQTAAYDEGSLVSDIGGQLGFWIGVSIITLFEFVEFVIDLFTLAYANIAARCKKRPQRPAAVSPVSTAPLVFSDFQESTN